MLGLIRRRREARGRFTAARLCQIARNTARHEATLSGRVLSLSVIDHLRGCDRPLCRDACGLYWQAAVYDARTATASLRILTEHLEETLLSDAARESVESLLRDRRREVAEVIEYAASWHGAP